MKANNAAMFFETSAKSSENVDLAFEEVAKQLFLQRVTLTKSRLSLSPSPSLDLAGKEEIKSGGCC